MLKDLLGQARGHRIWTTTVAQPTLRINIVPFPRPVRIFGGQSWHEGQAILYHVCGNNPKGCYAKPKLYLTGSLNTAPRLKVLQLPIDVKMFHDFLASLVPKVVLGP